jgi:hypothetical protein
MDSRMVMMAKVMSSPVFILTVLTCIWSITRLLIYSGRLFCILRTGPEPPQKSFAFYWRFIFSGKGADDNQLEYLRIMIRESLGLTIVFSFGLLLISVSLKMAIIFMLGWLIIVTFLKRR